MMQNIPQFGLGNVFEAQQQQAQQAQILNDEQLKRYLDVTDPTSGLRLAQTAANAQGSYPSISNDIQAVGPADGLLKGFTRGLENRQKLNAYKHQAAAQNDIAQQYQTAQAQRKQFLDQQIAGQHQQAGVIGQKLGGRVGELYPYLNNAGQQAALGDVLKNENALIYDPKRKNALDQIEIQNAPAKAVAAEQGNIKANQERLNDQSNRIYALTGKRPQDIFAGANTGMLTPQVQGAWRYVYGNEPPADALTTQKRVAEIGTAAEGYRGAQIENQTRGERNEASLQGQNLQNSMREVELRYADTLKQLEQQAAQGKVQEATAARQQLEQAKGLYQEAIQSYKGMSDEQIDTINAQFKSLGTPFILPKRNEQKLKAVVKDGKVQQFYDPATGKVMKPQQ